MLQLIGYNPIKLKYSFVFDWDQLYNLFIGSFVKRRLSNRKFAETVIFDIVELLLNLFCQNFNILLPVDYKFHEVRRVLAVIEGKQHFS